ncbi:MAG: hypothetical protein KJZ64_09240 [Sphingomonadaceae bacterium]|nr:hypothetical protein [Sphingomonadaceae bacterium]
MTKAPTQPPAGRQGRPAARSDDAAGIVSEDIAPAEAGAQTKGPLTTLPPFTPVPRAKDRSNGWKPAVQQAFIEALADTGSVRAACRRVGRSDHGAYQLRRHPEAAEFRAAWDAALDHGVRRLEDLAMDRALNGVEVPVYSYGKLVGSRTVYNDRLLMFLLRNRAPERFAEGRAKAMSALDKESLARLKQEWRKQWEREQGALQLQRECETIASINAKIDLLREREEAAARLRDEKRAAKRGRNGTGRGNLSDKPVNQMSEEEFEDFLAEMGPPEGYFDHNPPEPEPEPRVRIRRLTDERWD